MSSVLLLSPAERMTIERLDPEARQDFDYWHGLLAPLLRQRRGVERALQAVATQAGQPFTTVRKRYYRAKSRGLIALVDARLAGPLFWRRKDRHSTCPVSQCKGLQELFKRLCEDEGRSSRWAYEKLVKLWKARSSEIRELPEFCDFPGWPLLPAGWTYENLMRYGPSQYELDAARSGPQLAKRNRPTVYTTRAGLWVASNYMLDDKYHDFFVNQMRANGGQHGRPLELYSMDLFSANKRQWGVRVRTKDPVTGKYQGAPESMARFIYAATLFRDGYSPRGTEWILEHGTGAISEKILEKVYEATGGKVSYSLSGMTGDPAHLGQYPGLRRGNPQHKPALESNNNLEHNAFGSLPAQTGRNIVERPEQLAGLLDNNQELLDVWALLPEEKRELLSFHVLELNQFLDIAATVYGAIANTRRHELEGWVESGNVVQCYRWGTADVFENQLTPQQRAALPAMLEAGLLSASPVRMTRQEVWDRGVRDLIRIPGWLVCTILGDDLAREATLGGNEFEIQDAEIGPGVFRYEPFVVTPEGGREQLRDGEKYQVFINPFAPEKLFVRDARGRYIGEAAQIYVPCRGNYEAVKRAMGASAKRESELLRDFRRRHQGSAEAKAERHENNAGVVAGFSAGADSRPPGATAQRTRNATATDIVLARGGDDDDGDGA